MRSWLFGGLLGLIPAIIFVSCVAEDGELRRCSLTLVSYGLDQTTLYSDGWIGWSNDRNNPCRVRTAEIGVPFQIVPLPDQPVRRRRLMALPGRDKSKSDKPQDIAKRSRSRHRSRSPDESDAHSASDKASLGYSKSCLTKYARIPTSMSPCAAHGHQRHQITQTTGNRMIQTCRYRS